MTSQNPARRALPAVAAAAAVLALIPAAGASGPSGPPRAPKATEVSTMKLESGDVTGDLRRYPAGRDSDITAAKGTRVGRNLILSLTAKNVRALPEGPVEDVFWGAPGQQWCFEVGPVLRQRSSGMEYTRPYEFCVGRGSIDQGINWVPGAETRKRRGDSRCLHGDAAWSTKVNTASDRVQVTIPVSCFPKQTKVWDLSVSSLYWTEAANMWAAMDWGTKTNIFEHGRFKNTAHR